MFAKDAAAAVVSHRPARVNRVIQLFMTGGASPMDTFDYKPALEKLHGQMLGPKEKPEGFTAPAGAMTTLLPFSITFALLPLTRYANLPPLRCHSG